MLFKYKRRILKLAILKLEKKVFINNKKKKRVESSLTRKFVYYVCIICLYIH